MSHSSDEIIIEYTCNYGSDLEEATQYDINDIIKKKFMDYKLSKINCHIKSEQGIYGIQFFYKNRNDGKEVCLIDIKPKEKDTFEQSFDLCGEDIINMKVWIDQINIDLLGFEIITNKNRTKKFGYGNVEQMVKVNDFRDLNNMIMGFSVYINENNKITSIYAYYMSKNEYFWHKYDGIFSLKRKLTNQNYSEKIKKKVNGMSRENQILYRICKLPQNLFFNVIKYSK